MALQRTLGIASLSAYAVGMILGLATQFDAVVYAGGAAAILAGLVLQLLRGSWRTRSAHIP